MRLWLGKPGRNLILEDGMKLCGENFQAWESFNIDVKGFTAIVGPSDLGKAQPLDCKVLTPYGWKQMGELQIGDEVVDPDGGRGKVEAIFPRGLLPVFLVEAWDGGKTRCCGEHLWTVQTRTDRFRKRGFRTDTLLGLIKTDLRESTGGPKYYLPLTKEVAFKSNHRSFVIDPYIMGCLLGDGYFGSGKLSLSSTDLEIVANIRERLDPHVELIKSDSVKYDWKFLRKNYTKNVYLRYLKSQGMEESRSREKKIPGNYLFGTINQRKDLLAGLLDTDGECSKCGGVYFHSISPQLISDVQDLVRGLGGTAKLGKPKASVFTHKGEKRTGQVGYRLCIDLPFNPFKLGRKAERWDTRIANRQKDMALSRPLKAAILLEGEVECRCILVSTKRNLYITDDYIVTHNTSIFRALKGIVRNNLQAAWVKKGSKTLTVHLEQDGASIEASRGPKDATRYLANGKEYKKLGDSIPQEVQALGMNEIEIGDFKFDPTFSAQFDPQFGLSWTPSQVNLVLGAFASTEKLEAGKAEANLRISRANSEAKVLANELALAEAAIVSAIQLKMEAEEAKTRLSEAEAAKYHVGRKSEAIREVSLRCSEASIVRESVKGLQNNHLEILDQTKTLIETHVHAQELQSLVEEQEVIALGISGINTYTLDLDKPLDLYTKIKGLRKVTQTWQEYKALRGVKKIKVYDIDHDLIKRAQALKQACDKPLPFPELPSWEEKERKVRKLRTLISALQEVPVPPPSLESFPPIPGKFPSKILPETLQILLGLKQEIMEVKGELAEVWEEEKAVSQEMKKLQSEHDKVQCPKCGHSFKPKEM
jgi:hypothetical protein